MANDTAHEGPPPPAWYRPRRIWAALTVATPVNFAFWTLIALSAWFVLGALDDILRDLHAPGASRAITLVDVTGPYVLPGERDELLKIWQDWDQNLELTAQTLSSDRVLIVWLLVDVVFALAVSRLLWLWARSRRNDVESRGDRARNGPAVLAILGPAWSFAIVAITFDIVENLSLAVAVLRQTGTSDFWLWVSFFAGLVKWFAYTGLVLMIVISYLATYPDPLRRSKRRDYLQTCLDLRAQIAAVALGVLALVFLPGNVRPQLHDLIRGWRDEPGELLGALLALVVFTVTVGFTSLSVRATVEPDRTVWGREITDGRLRSIAVTMVVVFLVGLVAQWWLLANGLAFFIAAAAIFVWVVAALFGIVRRATAAREPYVFKPVVAQLLVGLPLYAVTVAWMRAEISRFLESLEWPLGVDGYLVAVSVVLVTLNVATMLVIRRYWPVGVPTWWTAAWSRRATIGSALLAVAAIVVLLFASARPSMAWDLGSVAVLGGAGIVTLGVLHVVISRFHRPPAGPLALFGFRRAPVITLTILLAVAVNLLVKTPNFHRADITREDPSARTDVDDEPVSVDSVASLDTFGSTDEPYTVRQAFQAWTADDRHTVVDQTTGTSWAPLVIVASAGGGGRAAYWTLLTFDCLFADVPIVESGDRPAPACDRLDGDVVPAYESVFAASGISGGSVGLAMFDATRGAIGPEEVFDENGFIDPVVARFLAVDLPNFFFFANEFAGNQLEDRARALEDAMVEKVPDLDQPFYPEDPSEPDGPVLVLNSASVEDGCRVVVSEVSVAASTDTDPDTPYTLTGSCRSFVNARVATPPAPRIYAEVDEPVGWPATRDLSAIICPDQNLSRATASLLSARFPFVSPSGAVEYCEDEDRFTYLVDGGTIDSSAAAPAALIVEEVIDYARAHNDGREEGQPCVQPIVVQLDNGYEDVVAQQGPSRPSELLVPLQGGLSALTSNADTARQELALLGTALRQRAGCSDVPDLPTYLQVFPINHPGTEAPLGWSLSPDARRDMQTQLRNAPNQCSLLALRFWLTGSAGDGACLTGNVTEFVGDSAPAESGVTDAGQAAGGRRICVPRDAADEADTATIEAATITTRTNAFGWFAKAYANRPDELGPIVNDEDCAGLELCRGSDTYGAPPAFELGVDLCVIE